jgi:hypothetical protein
MNNNLFREQMIGFALAFAVSLFAILSARAGETVCADKYEQKVDFDRCMRDWVDPQPVKKSDDDGRAAHTDAWGDVGKAIGEFFKWLRWTETNWLGTVFVDYKPWNGVWPSTTVLQYEPGGIIGEHMKRWREVRCSRGSSSLVLAGGAQPTSFRVIRVDPRCPRGFRKKSVLYRQILI